MKQNAEAEAPAEEKKETVQAPETAATEEKAEKKADKEKAAELKQYSELGIVRYFRQNLEKLEQEEKDLLLELEKIEGENGY